MSIWIARICGWTVTGFLVWLAKGWRIAPEASAFVDLIVTATFILGAALVGTIFSFLIFSTAKRTTETNND